MLSVVCCPKWRTENSRPVGGAMILLGRTPIMYPEVNKSHVSKTCRLAALRKDQKWYPLRYFTFLAKYKNVWPTLSNHQWYLKFASIVFCSLKSGWTGKRGKRRVSRLLANANRTVVEARLHIYPLFSSTPIFRHTCRDGIFSVFLPSFIHLWVYLIIK